MPKRNTTNQRSEELSVVNVDEQPEFMPEPKRTPLPAIPLLIVFLIQFAEPITATVIYPFINRFVRVTGITGGDERKTGYFAGIIESLFFLAEAATVFHWGQASDRFGRKPILLLGPLGLSIAMLCFGSSSTFSGLVISRCFQGIFNGNIGVSKTVIAEVTDSTNVADAYALIPVMWGVGTTVAPIIGGILSEPAARWPEVFSGMNLFVQHPYFLPCAVSAFIAFLSVPIGIMGLKETAPVVLREKRRKANVSRASTDVSDPSTRLLASGDGPASYGAATVAESEVVVESGIPLSDHPDTPPSARMVLSPRILLVYGFVSFTDMCVSVLQPLIWSTSISLGGLGFDPYRIGVIMGIWGFLNAIFQMNFLGPMIRKLGPQRVISISFINWVLQFALYPILSFFARRAGGTDAKVWGILLFQLTISMTGFGAFGGMQVLIVENTPQGSLGAANGMAQAVASGVRGIAPSVASSLFSISLERRLLGGNFVFYVLVCLALVGLRLVPTLPASRKI